MKTIPFPHHSRPQPQRLTRVVHALGLTLLLAGCSENVSDKIVIRGSNTIGEELAPALIAEYKKGHPAVTFDLEFKGTTYGLGALMVDRCDLAAASRVATTNEMDLAKSRDVQMNDYVIGSYSVAVVVHGNNPISDLTPAQVRDIFTGQILNWKEVGGPDAAINLYIRDLVSGTHLGFRELAMENKPYALGPKPLASYAQIAQGVSQDANGIGYVSPDQARTAGVKPLAIGGVMPSVQTVNEGKYPYTRQLRFYTNKAKESPAARAFLDFAQSKRGQEIVAGAGDVPRP